MEELENSLRSIFAAQSVRCQSIYDRDGIIYKILVTIIYNNDCWTTVSLSIEHEDIHIVFNAAAQTVFVDVLEIMAVINRVFTKRRAEILNHISKVIGTKFNGH